MILAVTSYHKQSLSAFYDKITVPTNAPEIFCNASFSPKSSSFVLTKDTCCIIFSNLEKFLVAPLTIFQLFMGISSDSSLMLLLPKVLMRASSIVYT